MADLQLLLEAERRGLLPPERAGLLNEARRRGLVPDPQSPAQTASDPSQLPSQQPEFAGERAKLAKFGKEGDERSGLEKAEPYVRPLLAGVTNTVDGVFALPRALLNTPANIANSMGADVPTVGSLTESAGLNPRNSGERIAASVAQGAGGLLSSIGAGQALATSASPVVAGVGAQLAANPALQAAQTVTSATSSEVARRAGAGPTGQLVASVLGGFVPGAGTAAAQKAATGLTRTAEAQTLLNQGVDLTPGQMNPKGMINQVEESWQSIPVVGQVVRDARENAQNTFQRSAIEKGAAPGTKIQQGEQAAMLDQAYQSFQPLYDQAKGFPVSPHIVNQGSNVPLSRAITSAVGNQGIRATDEARKSVLGFVESQFTKGARSSDDLLDIRSEIRSEARAAANQGDEAAAQLLRAADDQVTKALESQLPADALKALKTADAQYGNYKTVEKAVARSKSKPGGFSANDLAESVAQGNRGTNAGGYARGGGGPLRDSADAARQVFDVRSPPTGARLATIGATALGATNPFTLAGQGALLSLIGTQTGRKLAQGNTAAQRSVIASIGAISAPQALKNSAIQAVTRAANGDSTSEDEQIFEELKKYDEGAKPAPNLVENQRPNLPIASIRFRN